MSPPLELTPFSLSERIRRELEHLARRSDQTFGPNGRMGSVGSPRIRPFAITIDSVVTDLGRLDDPNRMMIGVGGTEPRETERPSAIDDQLEERTPQFTLRNTARLERFASEEFIEIEWAVVRDMAYKEDLQRARRCERVRVVLAGRTSSDVVRTQLAEKRSLMVDTTWSEVFGRTEPHT